MKKIFIILSIFCFFFSPIFAQQTSSASVRIYIDKAIDWTNQNLDTALNYANQALQKAHALDSPRLIYQANRVIGYIYENNNKLQEALNRYNNALKIANQRLTDDDQLTIFTDLAIIHRKLGRYDIALDYHTRTVERAEKLKHWEMAENGYHGLGTVYAAMSNYDKAIQYFLYSIETAKKWQNTEGVILTNQMIADLYLKAKNYEMASKTIEATYQQAKDGDDKLRIASILQVYGNVEAAQKNFDKALSKNQEALAVFENMGEKQCIAETHSAIGDIYFQINNYHEAQKHFEVCARLSDYLPNDVHALFLNKYAKLFKAENKTKQALAAFNKSLTLSATVDNKEAAYESHIGLADIYTQLKIADKALYHTKEANTLGTLLFQEQKLKSLTEAQFKFDIEKRDFEIETQKQALKQSRLMRSIFAVLSILLLALLIYTIKQVRDKQKANKKAQILLKELHHRVKNNMQTIASMMRLQARQSQDPSVTAILLENKVRLEAFALLHQQLYNVENTTESVDLDPFIKNIIDKLKFSYGLRDEQVLTNLTINHTELGVETALSIGLILNELLTNSFKYALPSLKDSAPLEITISLSKEHFHYADNGKVLPTGWDFPPKTGFGIQFIRSVAQQIKSKHRFYVDNGVHFDLALASNAAPAAQAVA